MADGTVIDKLVTELLYEGEPEVLARHRRELDRSTSSLTRYKGRLRGAASEVQAFSTTLGAIGAVGGALFGGAAREAIRWEDAMVGVRKTVDATEEEYADLFADIRAMARGEIPELANDLAAIAEEGGQLGVETGNIEDFVRIVGMLRTTTNLGEAAGTQMARFFNITQTGQEHFDRLGATVVELGNNLATTESEIFTMGLRVAGMGRQVGISAAETLGWAAGLSSLGLEAEMGGSAISRVFAELDQAVATRSPELGVVAHVSGLGTEEFRRTFQQDASTATLAFLRGLDEMKKRGENVHLVLEALGFDQIRVRDLLLRAAGANELVSRSLAMSRSAWEDNAALQEEFEKKAAATSSQLKFLQNELRDVAVEVGGQLIPIIRELVNDVRPVIREIAEWVRVNPEAVRTLAKLTAGILATSAVGFVLAGALRLVAFGLGGLEVAVRVARWLLGVEAAAKAAGAAGTAAGASGLPRLAGGLASVSATLAGGAGLIALLVGAAAAWAIFWQRANDRRLPDLRSRLDSLAPGDPRRQRVTEIVAEAEALQAEIDETTATGGPGARRKLNDEKRRRQALLAEAERMLEVDDLGPLAERIGLLEDQVQRDEARTGNVGLAERRRHQGRRRELAGLRGEFLDSFGGDQETADAELRRLTLVGPPAGVAGLTAPLPAAPAAGDAGGASSVLVQQGGTTVNVTVPPGADAEEIADLIEDRVDEAIARQNRRLVEQFDSPIAR